MSITTIDLVNHHPPIGQRHSRYGANRGPNTSTIQARMSIQDHRGLLAATFHALEKKTQSEKCSASVTLVYDQSKGSPLIRLNPIEVAVAIHIGDSDSA